MNESDASNQNRDIIQKQKSLCHKNISLSLPTTTQPYANCLRWCKSSHQRTQYTHPL